jgi:hypothetical protein
VVSGQPRVGCRASRGRDEGRLRPGRRCDCQGTFS